MTFSPSAAGSLPAAWKLLAMMRTRTRDTKPLSTISARRLDDLQSPPPGELVLGRYRLEERLGAGGFGIVWRARDERLHRAVAVKVIAHAGGPRARREALAAARLNHPGIVTLYEAGADGSADYLVSELIDGRTLAQLEADGALSDRDIAAIGIALCDALAHAHANGVVHRDVKPHNVMIPDQPREGELAKLTDFGVARLAGAEPLTGTSDIVGTRAYMAPEQAAGQALDERVDLYALGVVLYEALAGTHPARLTDTESLPPLGRVRRGLPRALTVAVDRAVAARADRRGTLDDLRDGLAAAFGRLAGTPGAIAPARVERRHWFSRAAADADYDADADADADPGPRPRAKPAMRALAGLGAAAATLGALTLYPLTVATAPTVAAVGLLVAALPRVGWALSVLAALAVCAVSGAPLGPGVALLLAAAVLPVPLLLARSPAAWWLPAAAPALALLAAGTAFPALAAQASSARRRAVLGALGFWWLALAELVARHGLLFGRARAASGSVLWHDSISAAATHALAPLVQSGVLAIAALWALASVALGLVTRVRSPAALACACAAWASTLAAATLAVGNGLRHQLVLATPRGVLLGAALGGLVALAGGLVRRRAARAPVA